MNTKPDISIVIPAYNEEDVLEECIRSIIKQVERANRRFEIIPVNDGSTDKTSEMLDALGELDGRILPVHLSRNFGKEAALAAGLQVASGLSVLIIDADLQHPPELIIKMLKLWAKGYDVVDAVKEDRGKEGFLYKLMSKAFYLAMGKAIGKRLQGASDFKLLDRQVVDALNKCKEQHRFFRGLVAWVGYRRTSIYFKVERRAAGKTKWSIGQLFKYSIKNMVAFSSLPLKAMAFFGSVTVTIGLLLGAHTLYNHIIGNAVSGFTTVILLIIIMCGFILMSLGILAIYVSQIYEEQKERPLFLIRDRMTDKR